MAAAASGSIRVGIPLLHSLGASGTGTYTREVVSACTGLKSQGLRGVCFAAKNHPFHGDSAVETKRASWAGLRWPFCAGSNALIGRHFRGLDLLHYPTGIGPLVSGIPIIATIHDVSPFVHPECFPVTRGIYLRWMLTQAVEHARLVLAVTEWQAGHIRKVFPQLHNRLLVHPETVHSVYWEEGDVGEEESLEVLGNRPFVLSVGTLEPRKNIARLVKAWASAKVESDLVIVGRWGWKYAELKSLLEDHGPSEQQSEKFTLRRLPDGRAILHFSQMSDHGLKYLYQTAQCLAYPSLFEGFGLPVLEAMASGCPVVTSKNSAMEEVAQDCAWYCDPTAEESIRQSLEDAIGQSDQRNERIERGLRRAKDFSPEHFSQALYDAYTRALQ